MSYFTVTIPLYFFFKASPYKALPVINRVIMFFTWYACQFLGIKIVYDKEKFKELRKDNYLIVGNHLSYTDIVALCSFVPASFVTSVEMKHQPVLGQITMAAGCLFVERRNKTNLSREVKEITDALKAGFNVMIFPEATSTNGEGVLQFKRALFQSSLDSKKSVLPMTINYRSVDGKALTRKNRDLVCWYGDMDFASHLIKFFMTSGLVIEITFHDPVKPEGDLFDHTNLANHSHSIVSGSYDSIQ